MSNHERQIGYVGLGSNMGDARANLSRAVAALNAGPDVAVDSVSDIFRTEPQGLRAQDWFLNMVVRIAVTPRLGPEDVLDVLARIEQDMGRVRSVVWGPRCIDLDLLLLDEIEYHSPRLTLPHPRMRERAFVLIPLRQLAPDILIRGERPAHWLSTLDFTLDGDRIWQA